MTSSKVLLTGSIAVFLGLSAALGCGDDGGAPDDAALSDAAPDAGGPTFPFPARVLRIVDGDTLEVRFLDQEIKIRVLGIDTPELFTDPPEYLAEEAREFTIQKAPPTFDVGLEFDDDRCGVIPFSSSCFDQNGRMLAYIRTPSEEDLGALLLENDLACVYTRADFARKSYYITLADPCP